MDRYKVKIYPSAKQDLMDIVQDLNTLSFDIALKYYDLIVNKIASLSHLPERCPRPKDPVLAAKGYRYLIIDKYLVFFVVYGEVVQIRRIVNGRRNYEILLQKDGL